MEDVLDVDSLEYDYHTVLVCLRLQGIRRWKPVYPDRFVRVYRRATMTH
ncbi:MAG: hypothetical protein OXC02_01955 [Rhodobacteraceae bacterium]|nr:hypothetical protein [Paracoccaceae bacterium]